jgi:hypothetical protein
MSVPGSGRDPIVLGSVTRAGTLSLAQSSRGLVIRAALLSSMEWSKFVNELQLISELYIHKRKRENKKLYSSREREGQRKANGTDPEGEKTRERLMENRFTPHR